jgi:transcriptional regulator of met regulon
MPKQPRPHQDRADFIIKSAEGDPFEKLIGEVVFFAPAHQLSEQVQQIHLHCPIAILKKVRTLKTTRKQQGHGHYHVSTILIEILEAGLALFDDATGFRRKRKRRTP